ncbi:Proteasome subunit beta type [Spironucleus salmonicida]|uniref:Proteasome subunit beta type n=1 Tax=Spironucleus salmonicida TaxID=348837 RepID=V6LVB0_9EUKA|nr:Proteasome subunit beta type [Spironucleus salmonicida]|eukprot:EST47651.1 Proteasome subunit beta type [Spironucleus salmonicida]
MSTQTFCTGNSVVAIRYNNGTLIASDKALSYGKMSLSTNFSRIFTTATTAIAFSGDEAHFRSTVDIIQQIERDNRRLDRAALTPEQIHRVVQEQHYAARNEQKPVLNSLIVTGKNFLQTIDVFGTVFSLNVASTSLGKYYALPFLREQYRENLTKAEAIDIAKRALSIMYQNDCLACQNIEICTIGDQVERFQEKVDCNWDIGKYRDLSVVMK